MLHTLLIEGPDVISAMPVPGGLARDRKGAFPFRVGMLPFICLPTRVMLDPAISSNSLRVFCLLAAHAEQSGWCWPALRTLGNLLGMSRSTVHEHLDGLVKAGHVDKKRLTLPSGVTVMAYYPKMDRPKKAREADLYRSGTPNRRSAQPNGRSEKGVQTVRPSRTMEVETTKKKKDDLPVRLPSRWERRKPTGLTPLTEILDPVLEAELDKVFGPEGQPREA